MKESRPRYSFSQDRRGRKAEKKYLISLSSADMSEMNVSSH